MAGCGPKDIYTALLAAGFSTNQAIGAMANAIAESGLNAEARAVDSNGYYSNGLWQFNEASYPNSGSLVTGNCSADISAQIGLLKSSVSGQALAGSNAGEVAGNFAANFERCSTCTPGGSSYNQRVANAATVAGWVSSGSWPTSSAGLSGTASAAAAAATGPDCAFGPSLPLVGQICLMKKTTVRHAAGASLMLAGGTVGMVGVLVLVAFAFRASGAARAAGQIAGVIPGGGPLRAYASSYREEAAAPRAAAAPRPRSSNSNQTSRESSSSGRPSDAEVRAQLRARADQISTRVEPATA